MVGFILPGRFDGSGERFAEYQAQAVNHRPAKFSNYYSWCGNKDGLRTGPFDDTEICTGVLLATIYPTVVDWSLNSHEGSFTAK